jgi:hypothetical protein
MHVTDKVRIIIMLPRVLSGAGKIQFLIVNGESRPLNPAEPTNLRAPQPAARSPLAH